MMTAFPVRSPRSQGTSVCSWCVHFSRPSFPSHLGCSRCAPHVPGRSWLGYPVPSSSRSRPGYLVVFLVPEYPVVFFGAVSRGPRCSLLVALSCSLSLLLRSSTTSQPPSCTWFHGRSSSRRLTVPPRLLCFPFGIPFLKSSGIHTNIPNL